MNDKRRVGNVNEQQFILALCALGVTLSPEDGHRLFKELPQSNDGTAMDYNEFVRDLRIDSMHIFVDGQVRSTKDCQIKSDGDISLNIIILSPTAGSY